MTTSFSQATPVSISGTPGTTVSLYDLLVQTYGADAVSKMTSVTVNEYDKSQIQGLGLNFWDPNNPVATHIQDSTGHRHRRQRHRPQRKLPLRHRQLRPISRRRRS